MASDILSSWKYLLPMNDEQHASSPLRVLDKHMSEGLWRIVTNVDGLMKLDNEGWEGLVSLMNWCAKRGGMLKPVHTYHVKAHSVLAEDDPALQSYRSMHFILSTGELDNKVPFSVVGCVRTLVRAGESRKYPQLSIAALDLLNVLHEKRIAAMELGATSQPSASDAFWTTCWRKVVEGMAEAAEKSSDSVWLSLVGCLSLPGTIVDSSYLLSSFSTECATTFTLYADGSFPRQAGQLGTDQPSVQCTE
jgi:hypothetical protein